MGHTPHQEDTNELLARASDGDDLAVDRLLNRHRQKLRQMVAIRLDPRMAARVDPSDVVQDALADASKKLNGYLQDRPIPFYPWLRQLAWNRLVDLHRRHVQAEKRSVLHEERDAVALTAESAAQLAQCLATSQASPSQQAMIRELRERVQDALTELRARDREILVLTYLEQLSTSDIGIVLGISEKAVTMRHLRALERIGHVLNDDGNG
jgi:RNA polymerase sigma-70 factor (ECF subfamily)